MKKPWSISTTVRNPYRIRDFLVIAKKFEGRKWDEDLGKKYQIELIRHKFYEPASLVGKLRDKYKYPGLFTLQEAEKVFGLMMEKSDFLKKQPSIRGYMSLRPLEKLGFITRKNNKLIISNTGNLFLQENFDLSEIFLKVLLKWQYPNLITSVFTKKQGYSIKPFIGTLHLINQVNQRWQERNKKSCGITREEFSLFAQTLINYQDIPIWADKIINFREQADEYKVAKERENFKKIYKNKFLEEFLDVTDKKIINKFLNNLKDYSDNAIRYFRLTGYVYIRGGGFYIDLEPRRCIEIEELLKNDNASALDFKNKEEYQVYIGDINKPVLSWETESELKKVILHTQYDIKNYEKRLENKGITKPVFVYRDIGKLSKKALKEYIETLRRYRHKLQEIEIRYGSQNVEKIREYIRLLKGIHNYSEGQKSVELEKLISLALNALNDALQIKPNYPVGDDNEPTFTAPGNKPDIECFYEKFNAICEVTMLTSRSQWYYEGQPVMRHTRDFENKYSDKTVYCLFIAPRIHRDTSETFWVAIKYGYKGANQKIVPLSLTQFIELLEVLLEIKKRGKIFSHTELLKLYDKIIELTNSVEHSDAWLQKIPKILNSWKESVLSKK